MRVAVREEEVKISVLGCGLRTPLLLHGLVHSGLPIEQITLYDIDPARSQLMAADLPLPSRCEHSSLTARPG